MIKALIKDSTYYFLGSLLTQGSGLLCIVVIMRKLGVSGYGEYAYATAFVALFAFVADGGFTTYTIREIARRPHQAHEIYRCTQGAQIYITVSLFAIMALLAWCLSPSAAFSTILVIGLGAITPGLVSPIFSALIAQGERQFIFQRDAIVAISRLSYVLCISVIEPTLTAFAAAGAFTVAVTIAYCLLLKHRTKYHYLFEAKISLAEMCLLFRAGAPYTLLMAASIVYNRVGVLVLGKLSSSHEVGIYAGATQFVLPFMFISSAIVTAVFPRFARSSADPKAMNQVRRSALIVMAATGMTLSLSLYLLADQLYSHLLPSEFEQSAQIFKILCWYLFIVFVYGVYTNELVAKGKIKFLIASNMCMIALNAGLSYILIGQYGAMGCAIAMLVCEILWFVWIICYASNSR